VRKWGFKNTEGGKNNVVEANGKKNRYSLTFWMLRNLTKDGFLSRRGKRKKKKDNRKKTVRKVARFRE